MKNKNGFTLVELLAVFVVLSVIAIIIIPIAKDYYVDSLEKSYIRSASNVKRALDQYYIDKSSNEAFLGYTCTFPNNCSEIKFDGRTPKTGTVVISTDGSVSGSFGFDEYTFRIENDEIVFDANAVFAFDTGSEDVYDVLYTGYYKLEVWGAQGGSIKNLSSQWGTLNFNGGYGGYSVGVVKLTRGQKLYINVGGAGVDKIGGTYSTSAVLGSTSGGYNGGGSGGTGYMLGGCGGGGATHIALKSGVLTSFDSNNDGYGSKNEIKDILIIAGGGGGAAFNSTSGSGGGYKGGRAASTQNGNSYEDGATQTSGNTFGLGGTGRNATCGGSSACEGNGGGGGGLYGGVASTYTGDYSDRGGTGGSGYIGNISLSDKIMYCYSCPEVSDKSLKTVSTMGSSKDAGICPNGYSADPVSRCAKAGNGYAKISYIGKTK